MFIRFVYGSTIDNLVLCQIEKAGSKKHSVHRWSTFLNYLKTVSHIYDYL